MSPQPTSGISELRNLLATVETLELAVLIGSRATGSAHPDSDWDIAIQWERSLTFMDILGRTECLRSAIARHLGIAENGIDLIDIRGARLAVRSVIAEEGIVLKGEEGLEWCHFLQRTWRDLEEFYWEELYAA